MRGVLDYCTGGTERQVAAGTHLVTEGGASGHLYVLMQGKLEVLKGEMVVATIAEPGAVLGEMSVLLGVPHTATVRACADTVVYEFEDAASLLEQEPEIALLLRACWRSGSMSPTPISPISSGNMPATARISPWSVRCSRA